MLLLFEMRRIFLILVLIGQLIISGAHFLLYLSWILFFPELRHAEIIILPVLGLLSISFLVTLIVSFRHNNRPVRFFYLLSAVWTALLLYLIFAALLSLAIFILGMTFQKMTWNYPLIAAILNVFAVLLTVYGLINSRVIRITKIAVKLKNLPAQWQNRTAVMVSDLHLGHIQNQGFAKKVVRKINDLGPDIIFIPGDFFDGGYSDWTGLALPFKELRSNLGTYFVSGNHDKFPQNPEHFEALTKSGIKFIDDSLIEVDGIQIVGDGYYSSETPESFEAKLKSLNINKNLPAILLKHVPTAGHLQAAERAGIDLQLSGHTHHGQTYPFRYITRKIFKGFDYGLKEFGQMLVYTSSGVGTWGPPMRVATKSEIVLLRFI